MRSLLSCTFSLSHACRISTGKPVMSRALIASLTSSTAFFIVCSNAASDVLGFGFGFGLAGFGVVLSAPGNVGNDGSSIKSRYPAMRAYIAFIRCCSVSSSDLTLNLMPPPSSLGSSAGTMLNLISSFVSCSISERLSFSRVLSSIGAKGSDASSKMTILSSLISTILGCSTIVDLSISPTFLLHTLRSLLKLAPLSARYSKARLKLRVASPKNTKVSPSYLRKYLQSGFIWPSAASLIISYTVSAVQPSGNLTPGKL